MLEREPLEKPPHVHVIAVDGSFPDTNEGAIEAFKELCIFGRRVTFSDQPDRWATITCRGGCEGIDHEETPR